MPHGYVTRIRFSLAVILCAAASLIPFPRVATAQEQVEGCCRGGDGGRGGWGGAGGRGGWAFCADIQPIAGSNYGGSGEQDDASLGGRGGVGGDGGRGGGGGPTIGIANMATSADVNLSGNIYGIFWGGAGGVGGNNGPRGRKIEVIGQNSGDAAFPDCNGNGIHDEVDVANGIGDCNGNRIPDVCELTGNDCDTNGVPDECDLDCNTNGVPDACELWDHDCNINGVVDSCEEGYADCNNNSIADFCELVGNDCNDNGVPDACEFEVTDCDSNGVLDHCELDDNDCNGNGVPDNCEADCNNNGTADDCDLTDGTSVDCNDNGIPDECDGSASLGAQPEMIGDDLSTKNRFLSFSLGVAGRLDAVRVTFVSLPPPFDIWDGSELWVGRPSQVTEAGASILPTEGFPNFNAATLQCTAFYSDWSLFGVIDVFHEGIVPDGVYRVEVINDACSPGSAVGFSPPLEMTTAMHGDTVLDLAFDPPLPPEGAVNVVDALAVLEGFGSVAGAIVKARADLVPACLDLAINVTDVLASLSGFSGLSYAFTPTAADACDSTCFNVLP